MVIQKLFLRRIVKISRVFLIVMLSVAMTGMSGPWVSKTTASDWIPMLPDRDFYDFQLFAPPDLGSYNMYERDDDGVYFNYDRLYWGITIPRTVRTAETDKGISIIPTQPISPVTIVDLNNDFLEFSRDNPIIVQTTEDAAQTEVNTLDNISSNTTVFEVGSDPLRLDLNTSWMRTKMVFGNRFEGGWSYGGRGVHLSYFQLEKQEQGFGSISEFAVNSPTQTFTFETSLAGGGGGGGNNNNGGGGGSSGTTVSLETTTDSPQPDHLITQTLYQKNATEIQSAGVALTLRKRLGRRKGSTRVTYALGPRFVQVADRYELDYVSFQNSFNSSVGGGGGGNTGGGNTGGGNTGGGNTGGGNTGGGNTGGGNTGGGNTGGGNTGGGNTGGGNTGGGNQQATGAAGNVVQSTMGNASQLGITTGDLPSTITGTGPGSIFQTAQWDTYTSNNMVGPEFGMMFEGSQGAFDWYAGGSFTAGFNWQNNIYKGANFPQNLGADYLRTNFAGGGVTTVNFSSTGEQVGGGGGGNSTSVVSVPTSPMIIQVFPTGQSATTNSADHQFSFSPIGEWRFGGRYRISKAISLNFGYTGMWLSQIARASSNTRFVQKQKKNLAAARNLTAQIENNAVTPTGAGQTAVIDAQGAVTGYVPNGTTLGPGQAFAGFRLVPPTITYGSGAGARVVRNPEEFLQLQQTNYTSQAPGGAGNEYVLTNGIDFGLEIKY